MLGDGEGIFWEMRECVYKGVVEGAYLAHREGVCLGAREDVRTRVINLLERQIFK